MLLSSHIFLAKLKVKQFKKFKNVLQKILSVLRAFLKKDR
ncbi:hypothetical protein Cabys_2081 [Caldithrix abyssi DSM 13497]|uniref:Uncharacterized protein n=1 Tax=Caldithrix abyssi DSM 13497 TaxID=880073 RepID=A0A1J1C8F9_CALAY|nr:hypothetical protein Cabys_2081 [Caldithrix abyssi DSM 13497]